MLPTCFIDGEIVALQFVSTKLAKADAKGPRNFSKKAIVLNLLRRKDGATLTQIAKATDRRTTASWVS